MVMLNPSNSHVDPNSGAILFDRPVEADKIQSLQEQVEYLSQRLTSIEEQLSTTLSLLQEVTNGSNR